MINKLDLATHLPGLANVKDLNSKFTSFSYDFAQLLGWKSADDSVGKSDYDIPCKVSEFADKFIAMDQKVFSSGKKLLALDIQKYVSGWKLILSEKNPLRNDNEEVIASFSTCIDVTSFSAFKNYFFLNKFDTQISGEKIKAASYILNELHCPLALTDKQQNCLFYLIRGKSIKEIAKILQISHRTVESHLDSIKIKLNCQYKSEIIEHAIESGFLFYVPKSIQESNIILT